MNSCELTATITAIASALACKLSIDEISLLASSLTGRHFSNHCITTK